MPAATRPGPAKKADDRVPPGQAKKADAIPPSPPPPAKPDHTPPGQAKKDAGPPGQARGHDHGHDHGHS
jgi:hypothetical protein